MKYILRFCISACVFQNAFAQNKTSSDSSNKVIQLFETVISANKSEEKRSDIPQTIEIIKSKDIELSNPQTSADMLQNTGNVFVQKSQMGGGSPVLRGFEANRVLIVIDGVRMNNAIYRSGHLQDAITIDNMMLDRTEVLFGPASVMYGSDALGGVMHFYTKNPVISDTTTPLIKINFGLRHSTANKEQAAHININLGYKKLAFLTSFTSNDFGDLRTGNFRPPYAKSFGKCNYYVMQVDSLDTLIRNSDPNVQRFTGYKQFDVMQKILFRQNNSVSHLLNFQYSNSSDIPRYDRLQQFQSNGDPVYARWHYGPQKRVLASLKSQILSEGKLFSHINIILSYQNIDQERVSRKFKKTSERTQLDNVAVYSANIDMRKNIRDKHELHYGLEGSFNEVQSSANITDIFTGEQSPAGTRYPDGGSSMRSLSAYLSHSWELSKKYILTDGVRFNNVALRSEWKDTSIFNFPFSTAEQNNNAVNGSLGFVAMPGKGWRYTLMASSGFRAPNVDDMGKVNESTSGSIIIPNPVLKPEFAYNGDFSIGKSFKDKVRIEFVYYYTLLQNAIVVKDDWFNGLDSVLFDGVISKVQSAQNADEAYIQGFSASFLADVNDNFSMKSSINYTSGIYKDKQNDMLVPMDHIPPVFGQINFIYRYKKFESDLYIRYNGWKRVEDYSPSGEDNLPQATVYGMPSWFTLNLKAAVQANNYLKLIFGVENIMDTHYRTFASGVSAPGRNFVIAVRAKY
ncbi:MAG: TonB-dependent receptor [Bacteroidetes bacterium]|nr:MAG: TonB-dependent receptor [Bacteroidota bacterium]